MDWLKDVIVDIVVMVLIILLAWQGWRWLEILIWIYTPLMVLLKFLALVSGASTIAIFSGKTKAEPPRWFFHVIYAVNVVALGYDLRWGLAGMWVIIWVLSFAAQRWR